MPVINQGVLDGVRRIGAKVRDLAIDGGLPGAPLGYRLRGATTSGAPRAGTWKAGDQVPDRAGIIWICTAGGTPGTWTQSGLQIDETASDLQAAAPSAVAGNSTKAAAANHVHPSSPVASQTLASPAASITFSAISGSYNLLRLLVIGASASATEGDRWAVTVNGDSGAHYDLAGYGLSASSGSTVGKNAQIEWLSGFSDMPGASATSGLAGILEIQLPAYAGTTFQKTGLWRSGYADSATATTDNGVTFCTAVWRSTSAITSITIATVTGSNLVTGTTAYLYLS